MQTRPHREVWREVHDRQRAAGVSSVSQYVADVLAIHVGREDLVVELGRREVLPLAM
ncbi:toxin-antitoxin system [Mycolicibacterium moriokaense]|nr:toxin-antitoxin system [Mycolicibacterium moriokaense]